MGLPDCLEPFGPAVDSTVADSYDYCQRLARRTGRNFYFSFLTLPQPLFREMCALYAFMRLTDDLGDDQSRSISQRSAALRSWTCELEGALGGEAPTHPIMPAVADLVHRHSIPADYLKTVIGGVRSDLGPRAIETFDELAGYCYQVAGVVGLCCIHIWGYRTDDAPARAIDCGMALQLTNILRDLREDAWAGRVYLPAEELRRFEYTAADIRAGVRDARFLDLMEFQVARAQNYYQRAAELQSLINPPGRPVLGAILGIYRRLLIAMERRRFDVYTRRVELSVTTKLGVALGTVLRGRWLATV
jgi:phytoene synthase